jgi:hypothetical protein
MKKLLIAAVSENLSTLQNFIKFNNIKFSEVDPWNKDLIDLSQIDDSTDNLLILPLKIFIEIITTEDSVNILLNHNHQIIVWSDIDGMNGLWLHLDHLTKLDNMLSSKRKITVVVDGLFDFKLKNIQVEQMRFNHFMRCYRKSLEITTDTVSKDFILTMRKERPHRTLLWNKLTEKNLLANGFSKYHRNEAGHDDNWLGKTNMLHRWPDGHPSMDLYQNSFFEIVPETCYNSGHFITEKTTKPISCRFPFLVLSTPGYLKYLRSYGFKTFGDLIDESYDNENDLEKRTNLLVDQVEKIIVDGSKNFYLASRDICEHNYKKLCEITGDWDEKMDQFIFNLLSVN